MTTKRENGRKWDGISRVSTAQYKKNYDTIFKPKRLTTTIPPLRGPNPQGLNIPLKQVKTVRLEKINGRNRQVASRRNKNRT